MAVQKDTPYICHIFICTNDRKGTRRSCADNGSADIRTKLKEAVSEKGWKGRVRVSQSGCMGLCGNGPNVMLHPQCVWFSEVLMDDVGMIISKVEEILLKS